MELGRGRGASRQRKREPHSDSDLRPHAKFCLPDGSPITRDRVIKAVRGAQRIAGIEQAGRAYLAAYVLFAPGDEGRACTGHPGARGTRGPVDDAALHAPEPSGNGRRDRLLDGRQSGLEPIGKFGDILDTREVGEGSVEVRLRAKALRRDNFRMITGARKLERATGIETN